MERMGWVAPSHGHPHPHAELVGAIEPMSRRDGAAKVAPRGFGRTEHARLGDFGDDVVPTSVAADRSYRVEGAATTDQAARADSQVRDAPQVLHFSAATVHAALLGPFHEGSKLVMYGGGRRGRRRGT